MTFDDLPEFTTLLDAVCVMLSRGKYTPGDTSTMIYFRALERFSMAEVRAAFQAHVDDKQRGKFAPVPADLIAQIECAVADDGRPGPEEAWAICFRANDEAATVVWCGEMAEAYGSVRPLLLAGDEVAARMAFKETYTRLLADARERRVPSSWSATLGDDDELRDRTLLPYVHTGRLSADLMTRPELVENAKAPNLGLDTLLALPAPEPDKKIADPQQRAEAHQRTLAARAKARQALDAIKADLLARKNAPTPAQVALQIERERVAMLKSEMAGKLRDYIESNSKEGAQ